MLGSPGSLLTAGSPVSASAPLTTVVADRDGDQHPHLVVLSHRAATVFLNDGGGTFDGGTTTTFTLPGERPPPIWMGMATSIS